MRTSKPISTISFNTPDFVRNLCGDLVHRGILSAAVWVEHLGEDDEAGKKAHIHLYAEPSKRLQTDDLRTLFVEPVPDTDKPLGVLPWRSSRFTDWYLYCKHDRTYLNAKGLERKYHYKDEDFCATDADYLLCLVREISRLDVSLYSDMVDAIQRGVSWSQYFSRGTVPIQLVRQYKIAWDILCSTVVNEVPL